MPSAALIWQVLIALLTGAFTVGVVMNGVTDLKKSFMELKKEVHVQGEKLSLLESKVAVLYDRSQR